MKGTEGVGLERYLIVEAETVGAIGRRKIPGANILRVYGSSKLLMFCYINSIQPMK